MMWKMYAMHRLHLFMTWDEQVEVQAQRQCYGPEDGGVWWAVEVEASGKVSQRKTDRV